MKIYWRDMTNFTAYHHVKSSNGINISTYKSITMLKFSSVVLYLLWYARVSQVKNSWDEYTSVPMPT